MPMSSSKRRKLDAPGTPQSPVSAVSALAARRRLAASVAAETSASPTPEPEGTGISSPSNPFSPLQTLAQKQVAAKSPKKTGAKHSPGHSSSASRAISHEEASINAAETKTYSSFRLTKHNHRTRAKGVVEIRLEDSERFLVLGNFGIRVLSGEVTVAGAILRPSQAIHWIHAAHCHALPVLRSAEKTRLELHNDPVAESLRKLGRLSPLFRRIWNDPPGDAAEPRAKLSSTFTFLGTSEDAPKRCIIQELVSPPQWNKKLAALTESTSGREPATTLICGPKSAGKSTFSKLLTNRLLTAGDTDSGAAFRNGVVILDLDPGQPEYAPPGTLSLVHVTRPNLGPSFTHPSLDDEAYKVVRCHALASVNPASAAELHLECAMDLYDYYRRTFRSCPLLINTPGWVLSLGLELLVQIIVNIRPTEVIYMSEEGPVETVEALRNATKNTLTLLPSQPAEFASRTAAHFREMQTMSYFHSLLGASSEGTPRLCWSPSALSSLRPLVVRYSGQHKGIVGVLRYDYQIPSDMLAEGINGMVVAIVEVEDLRAFRKLARDVPLEAVGRGDMGDMGDVASQPLTSTSPEGIPFIPNPDDIALDPRHSRTIGLALIRGIDASDKSLQILTPMPVEKIADARARGHSIVLVHGKFDAPTWSYTEHLYEQADQDDEPMAELEVTDEDTSEDGSDVEPDLASDAADDTAVPWVEVLRGNEKRPVGSRVWRVRRDLGRNTGD